MPLMVSRSSIRGRPVSAGGGNSGLMNSHWASVKSEGYGFLFSSCIRAFSAQLAIFSRLKWRIYWDIQSFEKTSTFRHFGERETDSSTWSIRRITIPYCQFVSYHNGSSRLG